MLAIKFLPTDNPRTSGVHYGTGLYTLHHLLTRRSCLTNQQSKNAWFILGRGEIPDLYAHLICAQLHDTDRNAVVGMAAVLEGHTQAIDILGQQRPDSRPSNYLPEPHPLRYDMPMRLDTGQRGDR